MVSSPTDEFDWDAFMRDTLEASAAATGAWIRCLYKMRLSVTRGRITRPIIGYARLFGTTPEQAQALIGEITGLGIGDADIQSNGEVTLTNRRLYRKYLADKHNAERQARFKEKQKSEVGNGSVTDDLPTGHMSLNNSSSEFKKKEDKEERKEKKNMSSAEILRVFTYWQTRLNHPKAILTNDRRRVIAARLTDGYAVEDLEKAIDGCLSSSYHMGQNDARTVYDDIELICRKGSNVERFIGYLNKVQSNGTNQKYSGNGRRTDADVIQQSADFYDKYPS
jgi:hypothetical protein